MRYSYKLLMYYLELDERFYQGLEDLFRNEHTKEIAKRRVIGKSRRKFLQFAALPLIALES